MQIDNSTPASANNNNTDAAPLEPPPPSKPSTTTDPTTSAKQNGDVITAHVANTAQAQVTSAQPEARQVARTHVAHRATQDIEADPDMDDSEIDPNYGKPAPYKFGQKLSFKSKWKRRGETPTSETASCASSVDSREGVSTSRGWSKTGSLPAIFRKRSHSLTLYFVHRFLYSYSPSTLPVTFLRSL